MTAPTPDTSPGDEIDSFIERLLNIDSEIWTRAEFPESSISYEAAKAEIIAEAKDRLNRLMLTRERERLEELRTKQFDYTPAINKQLGQVSNWAIPIRHVDEAIAAIDAQLNKEETDGDVPTHN